MSSKITPWGIAQSHHRIAEGITTYSTSSHGGIELSEERVEAMPEALRDFRPFSGQTGWYEEDVDWSIVALAFPEAFDAKTVYSAVSTAEGYRKKVSSDGYSRSWTNVLEWLDSAAGEQVRRLASQWVAENASGYRFSSYGSVPTQLVPAARLVATTMGIPSQDVWFASLRRIGDAQLAWALLSSSEIFSASGQAFDLERIPANRRFFTDPVCHP